MAPSGGFNFNRDFTKAGSSTHFVDTSARLPVPHAEHLAILERVRHQAHAEGVAEGRALQENIENRRIGDAMDRIVVALPAIIEQMRLIDEKAQSEALLFARIFAEKLADRLVEQSPMVSIEAAARAILDDLRGSAHIAVRVAPALVDTCKNRLALLFRENGLEPKLFVLPDPDIGAGDCRIEWADGGIVRDRGMLKYLIEKSLDMLLPKQS